MLKFYYSTVTSSTATHIALAEAGAEFTPVEVSWQRNVNVDELAKVNPLGTVPAVSVDGKPLTQTIAIMEYIADNHPKAKLLPAPGTFERAEAMSWLAFCSSDLQKSFAPLFRLRFNKWEVAAEAKQEIQKKVTAEIHNYLAHVEKNLAGKDFITGKNFTVADCLLFINLGFTKFAEIDLKAYKNIPAYLKRVSQRPAVQKVLKEEGMLEMFA
ncbi:MAG: glutathione S-transferase family protein [Bdellovibrionota bacterium]